MALDREAAIRAGKTLAAKIDATLEEVAYGVLQVVNSNMERAVKVISVERGHDPRDFTLVSFGGAGSLHACELARSLQVPRVLIPPYPGILSAMGMAVADVVKTYAHALLGPLEEPRLEKARALAQELLRQAHDALTAEGVGPEHRSFSLALDLRYVHQSFELTVPSPELLGDESQSLVERLATEFHQLHQSTYGHAHPEELVELVAVRLRAEGRVTRPKLPPPLGTDTTAEPIDHQPVFFETGRQEAAIVARSSLGPGCRVDGPAVIVEEHSTTLIPPASHCTVHPSGALIVTVE